ncbi:hypothetical protein LWI28_009460 [Acer negundo]|uniref:Thaumatin-like protein n=1 Tax=Acer negundo TaxID=4023 RepID=A0AAD5NU57_ACENE|nr:hypothetical protein LWI28_009460 [Acer negundo]
MDHHRRRRLLLSTTLLSLLCLAFISEVESASFKIVNKCRRTIWPGLLSGAGTAPLPTTGFALKSGKSRTVTIPKSWSGRIWGRSLCTQHANNHTLSCVTGDCGSGKVECAGGGAEPPTTLAEFTLNGDQGLDFYDVSLVDGYNLPMLILPKGGKGGGCAATGCLIDLNGACPADLRVARGRTGRGVACKSACEAFHDPSYAYDDKTSTYTCASADYIIVFCPPPYTSLKLLGSRKDGALLPLVNKTTMYIASRHAHGR